MKKVDDSVIGLIEGIGDLRNPQICHYRERHQCTIAAEMEEENQLMLQFATPEVIAQMRQMEQQMLDSAPMMQGGLPIHRENSPGRKKEPDMDILVFETGEPWEVIKQVREKLSNQFSVFIGAATYLHSKRQELFHVFVQPQITEEKFLKQARTSSAEISNSSIVKAFKKWKEVNQAKLFGASKECMWVGFEKPEEQTDQLVDEIFEICPDIEVTGTSKEKLRSELLTNKRYSFWWD